MNEVLTEAVHRAGAVDYLGFIGDDNRFKTPGWDRMIVEALDANGGGFAYCNDLWRNDLPNHIFVSTKIVKSLGYLGLPGIRHLYMDNTWKVLGEGADCLYYLPHVLIEHLHPLNGKAEWDDSYRLSNSEMMYDHDREVFVRWMLDGAARDIEIVRSVIGN
jgi:hypothetical protein